ncbi:hypothetical protein [Streptomyces sp. AA1529]|uniref:hypothetical protein n=1 Tax=Streptomyces sp. AA1529 TaxID=1203257 RepID=UPI00131A0B18|nr:hypothetical protein [Streptomyces sp. AA1529]
MTGIFTFLVARAGAAIGDGKQVDPPGDVGTSDRIQSRAEITTHNSPRSGTPMVPVGGAGWAPPGCWYEPQFTTKEFQRFAKEQGMGPDGYGRPAGPVWVTASIDYLGLDIAATTIATPKSLKADAGTHEAAPHTCTHDLEEVKGGYQVDSKGADCNISYKRASGDGGQHGTYPFKASLVWDVAWTDSASPDGPPVGDPPLPDGQSTYEQDVTVREIQSIVRD